MLDMVLAETRKAGASKVTEIRLVLGGSSSYCEESVQMYFELLSEGTIAEGAKLAFSRTPAVLFCLGCGREYDKPREGTDCPDCGAAGLPSGRGVDFHIESIDVE